MSVSEKMTAIADAIRGRTGGTESLTLDQMAEAITGMELGGGEEFPFALEVVEYVHSEDWLDATLGLASNFCDLYCNTAADKEWVVYDCEITNNTATAKAAEYLACIRYGGTVAGGISERTEDTLTNVGASRAFFLSAGSVITVHEIRLKEG